jgi:hypothetical protein
MSIPVGIKYCRCTVSSKKMNCQAPVRRISASSGSKAAGKSVVEFAVAQTGGQRGHRRKKHRRCTLFGYVEDFFELRTRLGVLFSGDFGGCSKFPPARPKGAGRLRRTLAVRRREARDREQSWRRFSAADLEVADGALKNRNLRHRIAGRFQFCANLFFEIG